MRKFAELIAILFLLFPVHAACQSIEEGIAERQVQEEDETELGLHLAFLKKRPMDINSATESDLKIFRIVTDIQIHHFITYRKLAGSFIDVHELQAIPFWHPDLIRQLLPYISVSPTAIAASLKERLKKGDHSLLLRGSRIIEKAKGYKDGYAGSPEKLLLKYKFRYHDLLQYGVTLEKDAGEKVKPDFISFHLFVRRAGWCRTIAIGDFSVNMGQGLIQYNSMGAGKSSDVMNVKQQAEVLRPHTSSAENNYKRGLGVTLSRKNWEGTVFLSFTGLSSGHLYDSLSETWSVSSLSFSGLHRTGSERANRNNTKLFSVGGRINYQNNALKIGVNGVHYLFSLPLMKGLQPYDEFGVEGKKHTNFSIDGSYTFRNMHVFGEAALSGSSGTAVLAGTMASLHEKLDVTVLVRNVTVGYHAIEGQAFTEAADVNSEKGIYAGLSVRPIHGLSVHVYADQYHHTFPRYRKSGYTFGNDAFFQVTYQPGKKSSVYLRYQQENKMQDGESERQGIKPLEQVVLRKWRLHYLYMVSPSLRLQARTEVVKWLKGEITGEGFMGYLEAVAKMGNKVSVTARLVTFETTDFETRIYSYEPDVPFAGTLPFYYGKGLRYLFIAGVDLAKDLSAALKWSQSVYSGKTSVGSGLEETRGNLRSELKLQLIYSIKSK